GGAVPGVVIMSTFAHPGRYTYCIGEWEEQNPWSSLAVEHGFAPTDSTVAVLAADAPITIYDQRSRTAADLCATIAPTLAIVEQHKMTHWGDTLLVLSPAHDDTPIPKFRAPEHIKLVVAGGTAGRFSAVVPGWTFSKGSNLVMRRIR